MPKKCGRPRGPRSARRTEIVAVPLTVRERAAWGRAAAKAKMPLSVWVRAQVEA